MSLFSRASRCFLLHVALILVSNVASQSSINPASDGLPDSSEPEKLTLPEIDASQGDELPVVKGEPYQIAFPNIVSITPDNFGSWEELQDGTSLWRINVEAPGATGAIVGFTKYYMPEGGSLFLYSKDRSFSLDPFTSANNNPSGELWLPLVPTNNLVIEVNLPASTSTEELKLEIGHVDSGFRAVPTPEASDSPGARELNSGSCNVDVICSDGDDWRQEIDSVASYSFTTSTGSFVCSGSMINSATAIKKHYFLTANHCISTQAVANTMTIYWNFQTTTCGGARDGSRSDSMTGGTTLRATYQPHDFTLLELISDPNASGYGVTYAGWDRTTTVPSSVVAIHHPSGCEKRISFENDPVHFSTYLSTSDDSAGPFIRVDDWDVGTTEGGSSGSPLFSQDHLIVGNLCHGYAACGNNREDWFGRFFSAWTGGGSASSRLSDWLDPDDTGVLTLSLFDPAATQPPTSSPTQPPTTPPTSPPTQTPPTSSPTQPPTTPPTSSPTQTPPTSSPTQPPTTPPSPPTSSPTAPPTETCKDSEEWYWIDNRGRTRYCEWTTRGVMERRCKRLGFLSDGRRRRGWKACPVSCGTCP